MFRFIAILIIEILCGTEIDLFIPSLPELQTIYSLSPALIQLTLSVNFIAFCICGLFTGTLGDRYDRRHVILVSLFIFVLGSVFCVSASNFPLLIFGRLLQGIGIAGPSILGYVVLADEYPVDKQPALMGILNGITTLSMSFAPIIGSFVNLYFNWRANFILLLGLGLITFISSYFAIPHKKGVPTVSISLKAYIPLLFSPKLRSYLLCINFLIVAWWVFVGMAPILYMENLSVSLKHFGYYQGSVALAFSVASIMNLKLIKLFKQKNIFNFGKWLCCLSAILIGLISLLRLANPLLITMSIILFSIGLAFTFNILYPYSLEVLEDAKGRIAALLQSSRLLMTAFLLEIVSYYYQGQFLTIGITMFAIILFSFISMQKLLAKKWLVLG
ncbi:Sulfonamide resistance protein [Legionella massiliensis]|uniref:Sulfonamide resistance protein n=1 Tax=Legionella massiliensis TaxID=1034943 RepID=A0A078L2N7_9GAMM|nr:MFS transporter [Legionella massiliensis]CDZ78384.1 Sulfonamide resistance protein [Legionella massiliensis]CEE14122.1 Bicyclomycin resistance protein [Legionella massiliensis]